MTTRDELAELVNGRPLPPAPVKTIGAGYERGSAYERADAILAAGWQPPFEDYQIAWLTFRDPDGSMRYTTVASGHGDGEWIVNGEVAVGYADVQVIR